MQAEPVELTIHGDPDSPTSLRVAGLAWGPVDGRPVLGLHGWLDNAATHDRLAPLLVGAHGLRVVSLDLPGHGRSQHKPGPYHFIDWVADVVACADALGWPRFSLLGHSMGAGISTLVAGTIPERIDRLALIEGLGPMSEEPQQAARRLARALRREVAKRSPSKRSYPDLETAATRYAETVVMQPESAMTLITRGMRPADDGGWIWRADPKLRLDSRLRLTEDQVLAFLQRIDCPAMLVGATRGWPHDPKRLEARIDAVDSLSRVVLDGCHHLHLDDPEPVAEALRPLFETADAP